MEYDGFFLFMVTLGFFFFKCSIVIWMKNFIICRKRGFLKFVISLYSCLIGLLFNQTYLMYNDTFDQLFHNIVQ